MKWLLTFTIAFVIAGSAFAQDDYKHPHSRSTKKSKDTRKKFKTEMVTEANDYKHPKTMKTSRRVYIRRGSGANAAAMTKHPSTSKHPFGL